MNDIFIINGHPVEFSVVDCFEVSKAENHTKPALFVHDQEDTLCNGDCIIISPMPTTDEEADRVLMEFEAHPVERIMGIYFV